MNNHRKMCRELYWHYANNGICTKCGSAWSEAGHVLCKECAKKARYRQKQKDPTGELKRQRSRELRESRRANGLCVICGNKTDGIHVSCAKCLERQRERDLLKRIKKRMKSEAVK